VFDLLVYYLFLFPVPSFITVRHSFKAHLNIIFQALLQIGYWTPRNFYMSFLISVSRYVLLSKWQVFYLRMPSIYPNLFFLRINTPLCTPYPCIKEYLYYAINQTCPSVKYVSSFIIHRHFSIASATIIRVLHKNRNKLFVFVFVFLYNTLMMVAEAIKTRRWII
jgi:hypothetical protein